MSDLVDAQAHETFDLFIGGRSEKPSGGEYIFTDNPYTGRVWGRIARATGADVDRAVEAAREALAPWNALKPAERGRLVLKMADLVEASADRLAAAEVRDNGRGRPPGHIDKPWRLGWRTGGQSEPRPSASHGHSFDQGIFVKLDIHDILKKLPHRYPFLLVDRVLKLEKGERIEALKNVTCNESFFQGHFPQRPVMPGVLLLEALAQAAGLLAIVSFAEAADDQAMYYFGGIDAARFKRPVEPGNQLRLDVKLLRRKADVFKFKASGFVEQQLAVEAELVCLRTILA